MKMKKKNTKLQEEKMYLINTSLLAMVMHMINT